MNLVTALYLFVLCVEVVAPLLELPLLGIVFLLDLL